MAGNAIIRLLDAFQEGHMKLISKSVFALFSLQAVIQHKVHSHA